MKTSSYPFLLLWAAMMPAFLLAKEWHVGPSRTYTTPAQVSSLLADGDTVSIDAALYNNHPQVYFTRNRLLLRGIGGRPRLEAGAALAGNSNGKAIFVISGSDCVVENIEFANAVVPDHNGAGIRQEGCDLTVRHCFFNGNEMGILGGAYTDCKVTMEYNEFANNGSSSNPGYQHNIYIGRIDTFVFRYNYSVNAIAEGHELKSRARCNIILYNYIGNQTTEDSRTIDLPNGGTAILVGNVIEQGPNSANSNLFGYGMEGLSNPAPHHVWIAHNTFINKKSTGNFIQTGAGTDSLFLKNNILAGAKTSGLIQGTPAHLDSSGNLINNNVNAIGFENPAAFDYHLTAGSPAVNRGVTLNKTVSGYSLDPLWEYADTATSTPRALSGPPDAGAFEFLQASAAQEPKGNAAAVFPNPCREILYIRDTDQSVYSIHDTSGRYIQGGLTLRGSINTAGIAPGMYLLRIGERACMFVRE
ncbi:MAG: T9SS type A sorting domain-containing protein [Bacteroidota bacterium]